MGGLGLARVGYIHPTVATLAVYLKFPPGSSPSENSDEVTFM